MTNGHFYTGNGIHETSYGYLKFKLKRLFAHSWYSTLALGYKTFKAVINSVS
jgi:hypothetical protein